MRRRCAFRSNPSTVVGPTTTRRSGSNGWTRHVLSCHDSMVRRDGRDACDVDPVLSHATEAIRALNYTRSTSTSSVVSSDTYGSDVDVVRTVPIDEDVRRRVATRLDQSASRSLSPSNVPLCSSPIDLGRDLDPPRVPIRFLPLHPFARDPFSPAPPPFVVHPDGRTHGRSSLVGSTSTGVDASFSMGTRPPLDPSGRFQWGKEEKSEQGRSNPNHTPPASHQVEQVVVHTPPWHVQEDGGWSRRCVR